LRVDERGLRGAVHPWLSPQPRALVVVLPTQVQLAVVRTVPAIIGIALLLYGLVAEESA
jgi:hypothetical protein